MTLLSGDVHLGQLYKAQCTSFTGQNLLPEVTSSGLSHTQADFFPAPRGNFPFLSDKEAVDSEIFMEYNYGVLDIQKAEKDSDVLLRASIRDIDGKEAIAKDYTK